MLVGSGDVAFDVWQVDLELFVIRWTHTHMISLHALTSVKQNERRRSSFLQSIPLPNVSALRARRGSARKIALRSNISIVRVIYSGRGGISREIKLYMPAEKARLWTNALETLLGMIPPSVPPAHGRWVQSCMAATSRRGAIGILYRTELRSLLRRANASVSITNISIEEALLSVEQNELQMELPTWLTVACTKHGHTELTLDLRQMTGLLLRLATSSKDIAERFKAFSSDVEMSMADWLNFVRSEQLSLRGAENDLFLRIEDDEERELAQATKEFERVSSAGHSLRTDPTLNLQQFSLQLLSPRNDAVAPAGVVERRKSQVHVASADGGKRFDAFLSHNWGNDELGRSNHARVCRIKQLLEMEGLKCWLDEEQMSGDINSKMTEGIDDSSVTVVFITGQYLQKVAGDGVGGLDNSCKMEFDYALLRKCVKRMVAVVMEPTLRSTRSWTGVVAAKLGTSLYCDCSDDEATPAFAKTVEQLTAEIVSRRRTDGVRGT
eukprot:6629830-Prymnesium_polylepis.1